MEDSSAILCQISSYKDMLDQVNEEIETCFEKTRVIESDIFRCIELEKGYVKKEFKLTKAISLGEFELDGLTQVKASGVKSLELMDAEIGLLKLKLENLAKEISQKREIFNTTCTIFQNDYLSGEIKDINLLLLEKDNIEKDNLKMHKKIDAFKSSTSELTDDILEELRNYNLGLQIEVECKSSENKEVLKEIDELKVLLHSLSVFSES